MSEVKITEHYFECDGASCVERINADNTEGHLNFLDDADWTVLNRIFRGPEMVFFCPAHNPFQVSVCVKCQDEEGIAQWNEERKQRSAGGRK